MGGGLEFDEETSRRVEAVYLTSDVVRQRRQVLKALGLAHAEQWEGPPWHWISKTERKALAFGGRIQRAVNRGSLMRSSIRFARLAEEA
jgi:hypothetical protein